MSDPSNGTQQWNPEDSDFWDRRGRKIGWTNLIWSTYSLLIAFMVWMIWSVLVVYIGALKPEFTESNLFWLTALPFISAGFLRIIYSFAVPIFGGRTWTLFSTSIMLFPIAGIYYCITSDAPYWLYALFAFITGCAGGNFASSSVHISYLFPHRYKNIALGLNASIGNLGVGMIQLIGPILAGSKIGETLQVQRLVLADDTAVYPTVITLLLAISTIVSIIGIRCFMHNIDIPKSSLREQIEVFKHRDCWIMSLLYTFTFGTFIGFAAIMPILFVILFDRYDFALYSFIGATISSVVRPIANYLAIYIGAVRLTLFSFSIMIIGMYLLVLYMPHQHSLGDFDRFILAYMMIFIGTGIGKGSTTSMITEIYLVKALSGINRGRGKDNVAENNEARTNAIRHSATVIGISSAIATLGAFLIPFTFDLASQVVTVRLGVCIYLMFNFVCLFVTWFFYFRKAVSNPLCVRDNQGKLVVIDKHAQYTVFLKEPPPRPDS